MAGFVTNIRFTSGYIIVDRDSGGSTKYPISSVLRALDIPTGLTHTQVQQITALANMFVILIRTLIERKVLDEDFLSGDDSISLEGLVEAIEAMGGDFSEPGLEDADNPANEEA